MRNLLQLAPLAFLALLLPRAAPGVCATDRGSQAERERAPHLSELASVRLLGLDGREQTLGEHLCGAPLVLAYTGLGCPIAAKQAPRLARLERRFARAGLRFLAIDASPQDSREEIARDLAELGIEFTALKDFRQDLTRRLGARTTTEVFVFDALGELRYRGALDDQYSLGAARPAPQNEWLADALEAIVAGRAPAVERTAAPGCRITLLAESELPEAVTWSRHVAPIVQRSCETCHRPGQAGPFSLQSYEKARGWGEMIAAVVEEGRMPPWKADAAFDGRFANERKLSARDKDVLLRWVADGMPRGDPEEDPAPIAWSEGWTIGEPDVVFTPERFRYRNRPLPERGFEVPREGVVEYQYFAVDTGFAEDRWLRAIEVRPGAPDVVHHVLVMLEDPKAPPRELDFRSYLAVAVPGDTSTVYPPGYAKRLPAGARLVFQVHYTPNGKQRFDRSSLGLCFADEPPALEVVTDAIVNMDLRIPPGAERHEVRASKNFREETALIAFFPHMHTRGHDFRYVAHYPDGGSEDLLLSWYDFNWQEAYVLHDPLVLPAGTRLECVGYFDNSAKNPNNPDPTAEVRWGEQTFEEMFIGYYDWVRPLAD